MNEIEIGALRRNALAVVANAAAGAIITITESGRPMARLMPIGKSRVQMLVESGRARPAKLNLAQLEMPDPAAAMSGDLAAMRDAERC